ncbi:C-reactive protein 1.1 [Stylophora pistillata]|uniref:C-reactive protein 1.1 n=1 Tax=Stylophora pistillata TaxID=50429 RepID=A0A2B4RBC1_STYPI|nr:C-reactive protein 1.1 [Stylophora pistillata]
MRDLTGSKRGPAAVLANPKVQEAAVEKGIEVAGKLVDKQLQIIDDAQQKAADFLKKERWGTHFIKSAKFGGQLEIRKTMDAEDVQSKKEFEIQMEMEFKTLFASVGARSSYKTSESSRRQTKTTSTSVVAHGGSQHIASILSDVYSPTFKTEFKEWLRTIPDYPKAFRFQMGSITDLLNFRADDLFQDETVNWGCEGNAAHIKTQEKGGKTVKYYEVQVNNGTRRYYCEFDSRRALEDAVQRRRLSLKRAIEIYMEEGAMSISDIDLNACKVQGEQPSKDDLQSPFSASGEIPTWANIIKDGTAWKVSFDMVDDLPNAHLSSFNIGHNMTRLVRFYKKKWYTSNENGSFHLFGAYSNSNSNNVSLRKMSIFGLVLTFDEADGSLVLYPSDFRASKTFFPTLTEDMIGVQLARVYMSSTRSGKRSTSGQPPKSVLPCQVKWSNALRFDPTDTKGKCLHFTASTAGTLFVVFAALPKALDSRYLVQISPEKISTYKGTSLMTSTSNLNARALGDASLYHSYFVCITESEKSTLIEYGKSLGTSESGDVYLNLIDSSGHLNVRFYAFGNDQNPAKVMDAHIVSRILTKAECKGDTVKDLETNLCVQKCHKNCDPLAGCKFPGSVQFPEGCNACRAALDVEQNECVLACPKHKTLTKDKKCVPTFDAKDKVEFENMPVLTELTMCHWIKLDENWNGQLSYFHFMYSRKSQITSFLGQKDGVIVLTMQILPDTSKQQDSQRLTLQQLGDLRWHQFCVTWSSFTGVVQYYLDRKNTLSATYRQRGELRGGGKLVVGNSRGQLITEVNVWDRVLNEKEINQNLKKCDAGKGNIVQWHQGFEYLKKNKKRYSIPSVCEAPGSSTGLSPKASRG